MSSRDHSLFWNWTLDSASQWKSANKYRYTHIIYSSSKQQIPTHSRLMDNLCILASQYIKATVRRESISIKICIDFPHTNYTPRAKGPSNLCAVTCFFGVIIMPNFFSIYFVTHSDFSYPGAYPSLLDLPIPYHWLLNIASEATLHPTNYQQRPPNSPLQASTTQRKKVRSLYCSIVFTISINSTSWIVISNMFIPILLTGTITSPSNVDLGMLKFYEFIQ